MLFDATRPGPKLTILPSLTAARISPNEVRLTRKFIEGMTLTARDWPGPIEAIFDPDPNPASGNLDDEIVDTRELPFGVRLIAFDDPAFLPSLRQSQVVQGGGFYRLNRVARFLAQNRIPYVFVSEYSLKTRLQMVDADKLNLPMRMRRYFWEWSQERTNRSNVTLSATVHCNGTPTFEAYAPIAKRSLLYFDSRITEDMLPDQDMIAHRHQAGRAARTLRMAFSGRLSRIKGADDLVQVAVRLRDRGVSFTLDICGDGPLTDTLRQSIAQHNLERQVRLRGVLDFQTELVPFVKKDVDLFLCCHRQGDPSCTYIETFACGVPIAGYDNEALVGIANRSGAAWTVPMGDVEALTNLVAKLAEARDVVEEHGALALRFARKNTFERSFRDRNDDMRLAAEQSAPRD